MYCHREGGGGSWARSSGLHTGSQECGLSTQRRPPLSRGPGYVRCQVTRDYQARIAPGTAGHWDTSVSNEGRFLPRWDSQTRGDRVDSKSNAQGTRSLGRGCVLEHRAGARLSGLWCNGTHRGKLGLGWASLKDESGTRVSSVSCCCVTSYPKVSGSKQHMSVTESLCGSRVRMA